MARTARRKPGATKALVLAVLVHVALVALLLVSFRWNAVRTPQPVVQATVVQDKAGARPPSEASRQRQDEEAKRQAEQEARREAEAKRRQEQERQQKAAADKKRKTEEEERVRKSEEAKRRAAEAEQTRKAEEARQRKAEDEKRRRAEAERREAENTRRRQAEQSLKESLAAEEREREQAAREARALTAIEKYKAVIRQRVTRNWSRPIGSAKGLTCVVQVQLVPGGEVVQARVVRSSGDAVFDRSVENAVFKSTPLPIPPEKDLFDYFREIEFLFSPES